MTCTCGATGLPAGAHEQFCDLRTGRDTAAREAAEVEASGGWAAARARITAAADPHRRDGAA